MAKILVTDDEHKLRGLLHTVLTRKGHDVLLAGGGQQGLALFQQEHPAVTILDLHMPKLNGMEVLREIPTADPGAPVIILTGWYSEEAQLQACAFRVVDFLKKGFSFYDLGEALKRALLQRSHMPALSRWASRSVGVLGCLSVFSLETALTAGSLPLSRSLLFSRSALVGPPPAP